MIKINLLRLYRVKVTWANGITSLIGPTYFDPDEAAVDASELDVTHFEVVRTK